MPGSGGRWVRKLSCRPPTSALNDRSSRSVPETLLESQLFFLQDKVGQLTELQRENAQGIAIVDLPVIGDLMYAIVNAILGRLSEEDFRTYLEAYKQIDWSLIPPQAIFLWLEIGDQSLVERATSSLEEYEKGAKADYFKSLNSFVRWLVRPEGIFQEHAHIIPFDAERKNYKNNRGVAKNLAETVLRNIRAVTKQS